MLDVINFFEQLSQQILSNPMFESFGTFFVFIWAIIPSAKTVPVEIFMLALLQLGVSPILLVLFAIGGAVIGDFLLYMIGRGVIHAIRRKPKDVARADHLLHKYRHPIFFATPFLGLIGDTIVFVAGIERIRFRKIIPFLIIGHTARFTIGMLALIGIIKLPAFFGF